MPPNLTCTCGYESHYRRAFSAERVDEVRFVAPTEGAFVDGANGSVVLELLFTDDGIAHVEGLGG